MNKIILILTIIFNILLVNAQDDAMRILEHQQVAKENYLVQYFLGSWKQIAEISDEGGNKSHFTGSLNVYNMYSDKYVMMKSELDYDLRSYYKQIYLGFDKHKKKYILVSFDDSQFTPYIAYGEYDEATKTYTFSGEMYSPKYDQMIVIKWVYEIISDVSFNFYIYTENQIGQMNLQIKIANAKIP